MQENTEKPEDSDTPEKEENSSDAEETSEIPESSEENSSEGESPFEEHEGEVLPSETKKNSGCGFLIFILLFLTGGGGYLYYTNQVPPQIMQWIEPYIGSQPKPHVQTARPPAVASSPEKKPITLEEKPVFEEPQNVEEEPPIEIVSPSPVESEHISGSSIEPIPESEDTDYLAKVSGTTTLVEPKVEVVVEEPEVQEPEVQKKLVAPVFSPPASKPAEPAQPEPSQSEKGERTEAVQAYLDFFESVLAKIGELVKTGFSKGKDFLMQSVG